MIIDLRQIAKAGKSECVFYFEYTPETDFSNIPNVKITFPVKVSGKVMLTGLHSAVIEGEIVFTLCGECTRCLENTQKDYLVSFSEEMHPNNDEGYSVKNDKIDLTEVVNENVIMNIPVSFLCKEDCKGICTGCGVNLNVGACKCEK